MDSIQLPQEEFNAKKLLAEIGSQIASGRAELAQLQQDKQKFLADQELELMQRLQLLLDNSQEMLKLVDENQDALEDYAHQLKDFAKELAKWHEEIIKHQDGFEVQKQRFLADFDAKMGEIERMKLNLTLQNEAIERTRKEQDKRTLALNKKERAINDRYQQLLRTEKHIKK